MGIRNNRYDGEVPTVTGPLRRKITGELKVVGAKLKAWRARPIPAKHTKDRHNNP
jgi:hypothetical protein